MGNAIRRAGSSPPFPCLPHSLFLPHSRRRIGDERVPRERHCRNYSEWPPLACRRRRRCTWSAMAAKWSGIRVYFFSGGVHPTFGKQWRAAAERSNTRLTAPLSFIKHFCERRQLRAGKTNTWPAEKLVLCVLCCRSGGKKV